MSNEEIEIGKKDIDSMSQEDMARFYRLDTIGHPYFDKTNPLSEYFSKKFKGFTPEISKRIGW